MMLLHIGKNSTVFKESKTRAKEASEHLVYLSNTYGNIALMGHGGMNWLISKELERLGWTCAEDAQSSKNLGYKVYTKKKL